MTTINIAPIICPTSQERRTAFMDPTGSYYMIGTPSVELVREFIDVGINRVVFTARHPGPDWADAKALLVRAGITIDGKVIDTDVIPEVL